MNFKKLYITLTLLTILSLSIFSNSYTTDKHIVVVAASYNNKKWYKKNIDSFLNQDYAKTTMIYVNDGSPDGTGSLVEKYLKDKDVELVVYQDDCSEHFLNETLETYIQTDCCKKRIILINNTKRLGAPLPNQFKAIHACKNDDIIVILDGDDFLIAPHTLSHVNKVYQDKNIWLTYGQFKHLSNGRRGFCCPMPAQVVKHNKFRNFSHIPSHLRTFYAGLFKKINIEDLMYNDDFLMMTGDIAAMFPMIEMAREGHFKFVPEILLIYNDMTELNEHKVSKTLQRKLDLLIRSRAKYDPIESPFIN